MKNFNFPFHSINTLTYTPRPQPLSASLRPIYRIALIVLVLKINCRNNLASLLKLQFFNWLLKSSFLQESIEEKLPYQTVFTLELIHIDPMVNLALRYAFADNLISVTNNSKYKLTDKGHKFADIIVKNKNLYLKEELEFLTRIGQKVSEVKLREKLI